MVNKNNIDQEVYEIVLDDRMIDELIKKLNELKESRMHIHFEVENKELLIHHLEDELK